MSTVQAVSIEGRHGEWGTVVAPADTDPENDYVVQALYEEWEATNPDEEENFVDWLIAAKGWLLFGGIAQVFIEEKRDPDEVVAVHVSGPDGVSANLFPPADAKGPNYGLHELMAEWQTEGTDELFVEWLVAEKGWNRFGGIDEVDLNLANL